VTERARREYAAALGARYAAADKAGKGQILDEYRGTTGAHRKAAIRRRGRAALVTCAQRSGPAQKVVRAA
jgi:hypothetical protein